jgi:lipocalin
MRERLPTAEGFDLSRFSGTWHIVVTNYGFWRTRTHPTVTYERMADPERVRLRDTLRFRKKPLLGGAPREEILAGVDEQETDRPGAFLWRGDGLLRIIKSPWSVVMVGDAYDWAVTYFARSNAGTAAGMDIYARGPRLTDEQVAEILARVRRHPFLGSRSHGLYATVQEGGGTYRLD